MKIYSMTATFGKLNHETLTLKPGLNVIQAPNEWGKSTWCAFLTAMLYGLDTRAHSTKTALSDKERYTPWSGAPMSGRIDLNWNGRDITIERKTKGRSVFGSFQAFETESGIPVPELTAQNCGQQLLGVEKTVFTRSAMIRLTDLPVTQDEALRRRLNALVTTGDDSGTGEDLERRLRDLKNRCRYNRTGLLPQAEAELALLEDKLRTLDALEEQSRTLRQRRAALEAEISQLENHRAALVYAAAQENTRHLQAAEEQLQQAELALKTAQAQCEGSPSWDQARQTLAALHSIQHRWTQIPMEPEEDTPPARPPFRGMTPEAAREKTAGDTAAFNRLNQWHPLPLVLCLLVLAAGSAVWLWAPGLQSWGIAAFAAGLSGAIAWAVLISLRRKEASRIAAVYGSRDTTLWKTACENYVNQLAAYAEAETQRQALLNALREETQTICQGRTLPEAMIYWQTVSARWNDLEHAQQIWSQRLETRNALLALPTDAPPAQPDPLTLSAPQTRQALDNTSWELRDLQHRLGQCQGQMEAVGHRTALESQRNALSQRVRQLEDTYSALNLALTTLESARSTLQRRFAPRITGRAQELLSRLTEGRYDRLVLGSDLTLHATARDEDTMRNALWRSDGTADLLYLALRLAVAAELVPDAPLILDDALVRFDEQRLAQAMSVLKEEAEQRQILLFTCHSRESRHI